jgi:hypothetical protein
MQACEENGSYEVLRQDVILVCSYVIAGQRLRMNVSIFLSAMET